MVLVGSLWFFLVPFGSFWFLLVSFGFFWFFLILFLSFFFFFFGRVLFCSFLILFVSFWFFWFFLVFFWFVFGSFGSFWLFWVLFGSLGFFLVLLSVHSCSWLIFVNILPNNHFVIYCNHRSEGIPLNIIKFGTKKLSRFGGTPPPFTDGFRKNVLPPCL